MQAPFFRATEQVQRIQQLEQEGKDLAEKLAQKKGASTEPDLYDLVLLHLNRTERYHLQTQIQAQTSFYWSLVAFSIGFLALVAGIAVIYVMIYQFRVTNTAMAFLASVPGILIEAIGGLYLAMYRKNVRQFNDYHDQLVDLHETLMAIEVVKEIEDARLKDELRWRIVMTLLERAGDTSAARAVQRAKDAARTTAHDAADEAMRAVAVGGPKKGA